MQHCHHNPKLRKRHQRGQGKITGHTKNPADHATFIKICGIRWRGMQPPYGAV